MFEKLLKKVFGNDEKRRVFAYKFSFIGVLFFFSWGAVGEYCRQNAPIALNIEQGRIYPMDWHGTVVYLNQIEHILMYALPLAGFLIVPIFIIISPSPRLNLFRNKGDN